MIRGPLAARYGRPAARLDVRIVAVTATLGVADRIAARGYPIAELARDSGTAPDALRRLLLHLRELGIVVPSLALR